MRRDRSSSKGAEADAASAAAGVQGDRGPREASVNPSGKAGAGKQAPVPALQRLHAARNAPSVAESEGRRGGSCSQRRRTPCRWRRGTGQRTGARRMRACILGCDGHARGRQRRRGGSHNKSWPAAWAWCSRSLRRLKSSSSRGRRNAHTHSPRAGGPSKSPRAGRPASRSGWLWTWMQVAAARFGRV